MAAGVLGLADPDEDAELDDDAELEEDEDDLEPVVAAGMADRTRERDADVELSLDPVGVPLPEEALPELELLDPDVADPDVADPDVADPDVVPEPVPVVADPEPLPWVALAVPVVPPETAASSTGRNCRAEERRRLSSCWRVGSPGMLTTMLSAPWVVTSAPLTP